MAREKRTYYTERDLDKESGRFLIGNNANEKTVEKYLERTKSK